MGLGGISMWQLLIVLLIVVLLFGTKKLKGLGSDLGDAIKGFKKAVNDDTDKADKAIEEGKTDSVETSSKKTEAEPTSKH
ncbi:MAG: twin-arginine translocase TatA/TatE family subunit [Porticoccaceae bacterium]|nr:twin-arginine translocase TatA/TatE family subunit [Porticoccaceae bacterium]